MFKRFFTLLLSLVAIMIAAALCVSAAEVASAGGSCGEGVLWNLDESGQLTVSGNGAMDSYEGGSAPWYPYCEQIRSITVESGITGISEGAFYGCSHVESITVPFVGDCVKTEDDYFQYPLGYIFGTNAYTGGVSTSQSYYGRYDNLQSSTYYIPEALRSVTVTGGNILYGAFYNCAGLTQITIPDTVSKIGTYAFVHCTGLTSFSIPNSVTYIDQGAFKGCTGLTSMVIPDSVTFLGSSAFEGCENLADVTLSQNLKGISAYAFAYCHKLTSIRIPEKVTAIYTSAFSSCIKLSYISIPAGVTAISQYAFTHCTRLDHVAYGGTQLQWYEITVSTYNEPLKNATIHCEMTFDQFRQIDNCTETGVYCPICEEYLVRTEKADGAHSFTDITDLTCNGCDFTRKVTALSIESLPEKLKYTLRSETLDVTGGQLLITCDDGSSGVVAITADMVFGFDNTVVGVQTLRITVGNKQVTYQVEICSAVPARILSQPQAVTTDSGNTVQFSVVADGHIVSYRWQYRKIYKWFDTSMEGSNTDTLTVPATGSRNGYDYRCVITFDGQEVLISDPAELTVITAITDVVGPNDQTVVLGYKGQFTASAQGEGIKYQWQYKRPDGTRWINTAMEGCQKPTVLIETTAARDGYQYRCEITDVTGNVVYTEPATMRVLSFKSHPVDVSTVSGTSVQFSVTTSVDSGFTYQWQYSKDGVKWANTTMDGYDTGTLTVKATLARNGYLYRCVLTGSKNSKLESKPATLHVG